jgi:hypothetical protein
MLLTMKTRSRRLFGRVLPATVIAWALLMTACSYDAPLETRHAIPVDPAVLGIWVSADPEDNEKETMVILPFSETEYLVHYPADADDGMYFRAYAIKVAGVACVQLALLGTPKGRETGTERYEVATYRLVDGRLEIRTLNKKLVDSELSGGTALREAFEKHSSDPELFTNPGTFTRRGQ